MRQTAKHIEDVGSRNPAYRLPAKDDKDLVFRNSKCRLPVNHREGVSTDCVDVHITKANAAARSSRHQPLNVV